MQYHHSPDGDLPLSTSPPLQPVTVTLSNSTDTFFDYPISYISEDIYGAHSFFETESSFQNVLEETQDLQQFVSYSAILSATPHLHHSFPQNPQQESVNYQPSFLTNEWMLSNQQVHAQNLAQVQQQAVLPVEFTLSNQQGLAQNLAQGQQQAVLPAEIMSGNQQWHAQNLSQGRQHAEERETQQQHSGFGKLFIPTNKGIQKVTRRSKQVTNTPKPQQLRRGIGQYLQSSFFVDLAQQPAAPTPQVLQTSATIPRYPTPPNDLLQPATPATPAAPFQPIMAPSPQYTTPPEDEWPRLAPGCSARPVPHTPSAQRPQPTSQNYNTFCWAASITPTEYSRVKSDFVPKKRGRGRPRKQVEERSTTPDTPTKSRKMTAAQMIRQINLNMQSEKDGNKDGGGKLI